MESGKSSDLIPRCAEIAIPIDENGQASDHLSIHGGDSKHFTASESGSGSGSYSFSNTSQEKASDGSPPFSESLRRSPPLNATKGDSTTASELLIRRPSMRKSKFSEPKSRMMEMEPPNTSSKLAKQSSGLGTKGSFSRISLSSRIESLRTGSLPPAREHEEDDDDSTGDEDGEENEDDNADDNGKKNHVKPPFRNVWKRGKITLKAIDVIIEWILLVGAMTVLVASLYAHGLKIHVIWGLEIWKWCLLVAVFFCGRLVTRWARDGFVFLIESKFLFNEKVVYFVHGVKQSVRVVIWLALVLLAWFLLIDRGVKRPRKTTRVLNYITRALAATLIGAVLWMVKTLLVKLIAASFHVKTFFSKIREAISHEYVLWTLSLPQSINSAESGGSAGLSTWWCFKVQNWKRHKQNKENSEITIKKLGKMRSGKMPVSTMGRLVDRIRSSKLSIISSALDDRIDDGGEQIEITSKAEVEEAASQIFQNVKRPDRDYIAEEDLTPFINKENEDCLLEWFGKVAEAGKITQEALTNWAVNILKERDNLSHSLKDAKTAIEELNRILSGVVLVLIIVVWLLLMGLATTKVLVFLSSQVLLVVFIFGNTCRTVFEAMIFVFVMHPFDVGDRCVIDGVQMIVEEMDILKTSFLRYDSEMIYYPNAVLASKAISNFNRSPLKMGDNVTFDVDVSTPPEIIEALRDKIKEHIGKTPEHWHPDHSVQIKEIENMNKMKMVLFVNHKMNFQDFLEKMNRRTALMLALKKIFEDLNIKYHLLPQEVQVTYSGSAVPPTSVPAMQPRSVLRE